MYSDMEYVQGQSYPSGDADAWLDHIGCNEMTCDRASYAPNALP